MNTLIVVVLLLLAAHFSLTPFVPTASGKAWLGWPFAADSKPWLGFVGGLPRQGGGLITTLLAGLAALGFLAALLGLFRVVVPAMWWPYLVGIAAAASALLYILYFGSGSLLPLMIDAILLWGLFVQHWSVISLRGV